MKKLRARMSVSLLAFAGLLTLGVLILRPDSLRDLGRILAIPVGVVLGYYFAPRERPRKLGDLNAEQQFTLESQRVEANRSMRFETLHLGLAFAIAVPISVGALAATMRIVGFGPGAIVDVVTLVVSLLGVAVGVKLSDVE